MASRIDNDVRRAQREQELDELLDAFLDAKEQLGRVGKAVGTEALNSSAAILNDSARALARHAERLDPAPWHEKVWRKVKRSVC